MSPDRFEHLLSLVAPLISKQTTRFRKPISAEQRLVVTLRYLAIGETQQSLRFGYQIGKATMSKIFTETLYIRNFKRPVFKNTKLSKGMTEYFKGFSG